MYSRPKSVARSGPPLATLLTRVHGEENHRSATGHKHTPLNYNCMVTALQVEGTKGTRRRKPSTCRRSQTRSTTLQLYCDSFIGGGNQSTSSACIWSIYLSVDLILQRLWFLFRGLLLTRKLLNQGFLLVKLKSSPRKLYGRHHALVNRYGIYVSQMTTDMFHLS